MNKEFKGKLEDESELREQAKKESEAILYTREEVNEEKSEFIHLFFADYYDKLSNIGFTSEIIRNYIKENL
jgi:hypothetical protein